MPFRLPAAFPEFKPQDGLASDDDIETYITYLETELRLAQLELSMRKGGSKVVIRSPRSRPIKAEDPKDKDKKPRRVRKNPEEVDPKKRASSRRGWDTRRKTGTAPTEVTDALAATRHNDTTPADLKVVGSENDDDDNTKPDR